MTDENGLEIANYQVHKIILATWSEVLGNLFKYEGHQSVYKLKLPTNKPQVLGGILNWMYHQQLEVSEETLTAWIKTADFLLIQPLVDDLKKFLLEKLSPQSCLHLWKASVDQSAWVMKETIEHYLVKNHSEVVASQAYKGLTMDESHSVVFNDGVHPSVFEVQEKSQKLLLHRHCLGFCCVPWAKGPH